MRYKTEKYELGFLLRFRIWCGNVWDAIREIPPKTDSRFIIVYPDDPDYETAPWSCQVDPYPLRYTLKDGKFTRVDE